MFGYWSSFIPDSIAAGNSPQVHTLFTVILKDPSPKVSRKGSVFFNVLLYAFFVVDIIVFHRFFIFQRC